MRLIDADKLKEIFDEKCQMDCECCSPIETHENGKYKSYCYLIDEQPTVFDLKDLKEMKERTFNLALALKSNSHALWTSEQILYELWNCNILDDEFLDDEFYNLKKQEVQNETI